VRACGKKNISSHPQQWLRRRTAPNQDIVPSFEWSYTQVFLDSLATKEKRKYLLDTADERNALHGFICHFQNYLGSGVVFLRYLA
jgi:hypothetical protein